MKKDLFKVRLFSLAGLFGFMLTLASCANEEVVQKVTNTDNDKNLTSFMAGNPETRTSLDYNSGAFYWEAGDYIYVKDDNNVWQKSSNAPTEKTAFFRFRVPGQFTNSTTYKVFYPGKNGNENQVTIPAAQTQTEPNTTIHFGESGDCGTATANKVTGKPQFTFALDHQAAYLVFHPHVSNTLLQNCYLTKIEVSSDNDIASTYTLNASTGTLQSVSTSAASDKEIILSTKGSGAYANGFPLTTASDNVAINGAYMVIKPGTHTLKVRYWLKDISTGTEGTVTKAFKAFNYDVNNYYDIDGNLNIRDYDGDHYYMWDAQEQYWKDYEWTKNLAAGVGQPTLNGNSSSNYPKSNADSRWYNENGFWGGRFDATHTSCKDLPNQNEMTWYAAKGDPRWDDDELWTTMGHLYKGGMWFKKKSVLLAEGNYNSNIGVDGTDWRTNGNNNSWSVSQTLPSAADANKYFYLPALGYYYNGQLYELGSGGSYWSSSTFAWYQGCACNLHFDSSSVAAQGGYSRGYGFRVGTFE